MKFLSALILSLFIASCVQGQKAPYDLVDPFIGTAGHGHTYPGATMPHGAVQLSPDTRLDDWDGCSGYHYSDSTLMGFSHTHLSGTGCKDMGDLLVKPLLSKADVSTPLPFNHANEEAHPGFYSVKLDNGVQCRLTATTHCGVHHYGFPDDNATLLLDINHTLETAEQKYFAIIEKTADNELVGKRETRGWVNHRPIFFVAQFSENISEYEQLDTARAIVKFNGKDNVTLRVGLSVKSIDDARRNLIAEVATYDFDLVNAQAKETWQKALSVIEVEGGKKAERKCFYTALYHSLIVPNIISDSGERPYYSTLSLWDTFRAWHPLMTLIDTTLVGDMVNSMLNRYDQRGELPIWPLSIGETRCMIGYHSVSVIWDAYQKGIRNFSAPRALKAMAASADINRKGSAEYIKYGYIPADLCGESVSCTLEYAYDDWCIYQMAKKLYETTGEAQVRDIIEPIMRKFEERSKNYRNIFDPSTRFFRSKTSKGGWVEPFKPLKVAGEFTEATPWQYRFFVPHDVKDLAALLGGDAAMEAALDSMFNIKEEMETDIPDVTGLVGQYAHGNEPSHHIAYLFNYIGAPRKTQSWTRRLLSEMYDTTPEGLCGNEDCGQMSAWYILSALGFYSVCPGSGEYAITSPIFKKVTIHLANGRDFVIESNASASKKYIKNMKLNGQPFSGNFIKHEDIWNGGTLKIKLQPNFN